MQVYKNGIVTIGKDEIPFLFDKEKEFLSIYFGGRCVEISKPLSNLVCYEAEKMTGGCILYQLDVALSAAGSLLIENSEVKNILTGTYNAGVRFSIENYQQNTVYNEIGFQFPELDFFIPSSSLVEVKDDCFIISRNKKNVMRFEIDYNDKRIAVSFDIKSECKRAENSITKTISELTIVFPETDKLDYIEELYIRTRNFFSFICNRQNIGLRNAVLYGKYPSQNIDKNKKIVDEVWTTQQMISFSEKYIEPIECDNTIKKVLNYGYFAKNIKELFQLFFESHEEEEAVVNASSIHHSFKYRNLIDLEQSLHITGTFEHYVNALLPKISSLSSFEFCDDLKEILEKYISDNSGKKKEKAKEYMKNLRPELSLKEKILKVYNGYNDWLPMSNILDGFFTGYDIRQLADTANQWRNELAHDKREFSPTVEVIKAIRLVEHLNYAIVLRYAKYNDENIKTILSELLSR